MIRRPPISTLFPYTPLFRSFRRPCRSRGHAPSRCAADSVTVPGRERQGSGPDGRGRPVKLFYHGTKIHRICLRSEEHTSELQSRQYLVCRLLLEKKKIKLKS